MKLLVWPWKRARKELSAELQSHLQMAARDRMERGQSADDAAHSAQREFGNVELIQRVARDQWGWTWLEDLLQDLRYGARMLRKNPGFTIVVVLTLALGIGANTALFSVVNGVMLNPLPFPHSDQLFVFYQSHGPWGDGAITYPNFLDWQRDNHSFETMAAFRPTFSTLTRVSAAERVTEEMISADFFSTLGVKPFAGREFGREDDRVGAAPVALISEGFWRRKFGSAPDIVGRNISLDGVDYEVVGIIPSSFHLTLLNFRVSDVYVPIGQWNYKYFLNRATAQGMDAIGRLKTGVTLTQARADMDAISSRLAAEYPEADKDIGLTMIRLRKDAVKSMESLLLLLLGAVGFVLLIACANVANLFLARSSTRTHEFAIRSALGAGRTRIVRQLLTESVLLAVIGGVIGLIVSAWSVRALVKLAPNTHALQFEQQPFTGGIPWLEEIGIDSHVLLFCIAITLLAGVLFGLAPALKTGRSNLQGTLVKGGGGSSVARSHAQNVLVIAELALSLVLLAGAGLMIRSLAELWTVNPGFNPKNAATFYLALAPSVTKANPATIRAAFQQVEDRIAAVPGVESVAILSGSLPMQGDSDDPFWIEGKPKPLSDNDRPWALWYEVDPHYLKAMGIPLLRGRFFTLADNLQAEKVTVIDETFARQYFPNEEPLGKIIVDDYVGPTKIVGVVAHARHWGLDDKNPLHAEMYFPFAQVRDGAMPLLAKGIAVVVRTSSDPAKLAPSIRAAITGMNSEQLMFGFYTLEETISGTLTGRRTFMVMLMSFAILALALASIGIYGVLSYLVSRQTREIGIRLALGAQRGDVMRLILGEGLRMAVLGVGIGVVGALALTRLMSGFLYGVAPGDPLTLAAVAVVLTGVAVAASYLPARRAMRVDPIVALRYE